MTCLCVEPGWFCCICCKRVWSGWDTAIVVLGAVLRFLRINWPIVGDECNTFLWYACRPLKYIVTTYDTPNNHILHSILMHFAYVALGPSEWMLRLPVFLAGIGSIVLIWHLGYAITDSVAVARWSALLMALSAHFVVFSASGRGYSLATFFGLCLVILVLSKRLQDPDLSWKLAGIVGFLMLYTLPSGIVLLLPLYACLFWFGHDWGRLKVGGAVGLTVILTSFAYLPTLKNLLAFSRGEQTALIKHDLAPFLTELADQAFAGIGPWLWFFFGLGILYFFRRRIEGIFFSVLIFGYLAVALALHHWFPFLIFYPRNFDVLYPYVYILTATGLVHLYSGQYRFGHGIVLAAILLMGVPETVFDAIAPTYLPHRTQRECRTLARWVAPQIGPTEYMRGNDTCDGVVLFEYAARGPKVTLMRQIQKVYFFSENFGDVVTFCKPYPRMGIKALARNGSAVLYELAQRGSDGKVNERTEKRTGKKIQAQRHS